MSDPSLGLLMLGLIVVAIMMGFPTAFTLMGLGMLFGFVAFLSPGQHWYDNRVFDLMVQRTYGVMTNDTLLSIPLFVFMGYVMERAALVDRMFHSVQLAFRRVPASLAVTTLLVCAFWGIASGIVGAVVVLMGVIALRPMLNAGYDVRLASGAITAGGTLGILIPPSVMLIVYAAVAGQSIVKLYAAAMLPGFFLTFLYLVYILGWAIINPKIAPSLPPDKYRLAVPAWLRSLERGPSRRVLGGLVAAALRPAVQPEPAGSRRSGGLLGGHVDACSSLVVPVLLTVTTFGATWWYFVVYNAPAASGGDGASRVRGSSPDRVDAGATGGRARVEGREGGRDAPGAGIGGAADRRGREDGASRRAPRADGIPGGGADDGEGQDAGPVLPVVLESRRRLGPAPRHVLPAHGRRAAGDPEGAGGLRRAARRADVRGARGDPVRHHDRDGVGRRRGARRPVPRRALQAPAPGVVVEPRRR